jgi:hypothetical protein
MVLDVNDVLEHTLETATAPTDATQLTIWKKGEAKEKSLILDGITDHVVQFADVLYVLGFTKNLISISTLEDKGYEVTFCNGKVFVRLAVSGTKMDRIIGVRQEKVYRLEVELARAFVSTTTNMGELRHRRMAHIHFGVLGHLR